MEIYENIGMSTDNIDQDIAVKTCNWLNKVLDRNMHPVFMNNPIDTWVAVLLISNCSIEDIKSQIEISDIILNPVNTILENNKHILDDVKTIKRNIDNRISKPVISVIKEQDWGCSLNRHISSVGRQVDSKTWNHVERQFNNQIDNKIADFVFPQFVSDCMLTVPILDIIGIDDNLFDFYNDLKCFLELDIVYPLEEYCIFCNRKDKIISTMWDTD